MELVRMVWRYGRRGSSVVLYVGPLGVDGMGVELRSSQLCGGVLMWEPGGLGVVIPVMLAEG